MAPRGERILVVSFGPAATPVLATARYRVSRQVPAHHNLLMWRSFPT